ncbi:NAD-dependent epimerase/dehydratase family protein [Corallococcus praedator]|uniref:NAD-dependent epimerase/dehydratase family protein n=1 Tax=Corallococcus praedator TaxID=2316724 RepID=A0ABX9QGV4_9BACT|nr:MULTISPECIES: NAD-dependent epimerase/dehydratase family protein [Corallococcus]RKH33750.1 NAD-dependent epimerase/dehydratase family protein [Corallococcus sp. CA031C]RKI07592.1 NAD-dependent epimerase/dehydratase family protein [Corallococcus praedator]
MKVFVLGATGYIGGSVAVRLMAAGHQVVGTARTQDKARELEARGIQATVASFDDVDVLTRLAKEADAVINAASADDRKTVEVLLAALKGSNKHFIHTSGSSIVATDTGGTLTTQVHDEDMPIDPVPEKVARIALDTLVLEAKKDGIHTNVICPCLIYGKGLGLNPDSVQLPPLIKYARETGTARYIGKGENVWSNVHIEDLADLYLMVLERAPAGTFYFAENGEANFRDVVTAIGKRYSLPVGSMTVPEAEKLWGVELGRLALASNSRIHAKRARALGWKPHRPSVFDVIAQMK